MSEPFLSLTCPRCGTELQALRHETGLAWRCSGCGGQSLNFSQFRRMVPEPQANTIWETAMARPAAPRRRSLCPECRRDMAAVIIPLPPARELELDICRNCQRLWLDRQQQLAGHLAAAGPPGPQPPVLTINRSAQERLEENLNRRRRPDLPYHLIGRIATVLFVLYIASRIVRVLIR